MFVSSEAGSRVCEAQLAIAQPLVLGDFDPFSGLPGVSREIFHCVPLVFYGEILGQKFDQLIGFLVCEGLPVPSSNHDRSQP